MKSFLGFILFVVVYSLYGCAFRDKEEAGALTPKDEFENLYSRNFIVALPTATANAVCAPVGAVGIFALASDHPSNNGNDVLGLMYVGGVLSGGACGMVVGSPFIPLSYACDENPWYYQGTDITFNWACHANP